MLLFTTGFHPEHNFIAYDCQGQFPLACESWKWHPSSQFSQKEAFFFFLCWSKARSLIANWYRYSQGEKELLRVLIALTFQRENFTFSYTWGSRKLQGTVYVFWPSQNLVLLNILWKWIVVWDLFVFQRSPQVSLRWILTKGNACLCLYFHKFAILIIKHCNIFKDQLCKG